MATKVEVIQELGRMSDKLSSQVRTTAIAVLALSWGLLIGDSSISRTISVQSRSSLILLGGLSLLVLFLDFLQYSAGYFGTNHVLDEMESSGATSGQWDRK